MGWESFQSGFFSWVAAKMTMRSFIGQAGTEAGELGAEILSSAREDWYIEDGYIEDGYIEDG